MFSWLKNLVSSYARKAVDREVKRLIEDMRLSHEHEWIVHSSWENRNTRGERESITYVLKCVICGDMKNHFVK